MKCKKLLILYSFVIILLLITNLVSSQNKQASNLLLKIPHELVDLKGNVKILKSLDNPEFEHHDPSNIVKYNDKYYFWYTEHPKGTSGWSSDAYIRYATSPDGMNWTDRGIAVSPGKSGSIDDKAAITAYMVPHNGKYYLFYTALGALGKYPGITYAVADTPDGPWEKSGKKILWPSGNMDDWDGTHTDDTNIIFYKNKWYLYYKGKPSENGKIGSPSKTKIGVAISDNLTELYKRYEGNPVFDGHALTAWVHRDGVAAFGFGSFWSEDGINFVKITDWSPGTVGLYCPENFGNGTNNNGMSWGLVVIKPKGKARHIGYLDLSIKINSANE